VDDASATNCASVDWLKNRAVTNGCIAPPNVPAPAYCPFDSVIRLQMAAFMRRLGRALSPTFLYDEASGASLDLDGPLAPVCETADLAPALYPRQAEAAAAFTGRAGAAVADVDLRLVVSTDGGPWTPVNVHAVTTSGANRVLNAGVFKAGLPLVAHATHRFGLAATRSTGTATTGDLTDWACQLRLVMRSRTGTAAPF
jgi:hypothetical protein